MQIESVCELFDRHVPERLQTKPEIAQKVNAIFKFVISGEEGGIWTVDLTQAGGRVIKSDDEAQCVITISAQDIIAIVNGKLSAQKAFMFGKLKVAGDISLALKLGTIFG
ncbi:MAG: SCP2 sterol-binding domain-containing protein [Deltaproteobacteria bacterium]|nr:SCP2 sterol-binding domain-containing protein [Deltaproteobacteria bacterium]